MRERKPETAAIGLVPPQGFTQNENLLPLSIAPFCNLFAIFYLLLLLCAKK
jgi:hypothetical protein